MGPLTCLNNLAAASVDAKVEMSEAYDQRYNLRSIGRILYFKGTIRIYCPACHFSRSVPILGMSDRRAWILTEIVKRMTRPRKRTAHV